MPDIVDRGENLFAAIDPDGLVTLAGELESMAATVRCRGRVVRTLRGDVAASPLPRVTRWGDQTVATLRWRADVIRRGQAVELGAFGTAPIRFAGEAVFTLEDAAGQYRRWLDTRRAGDRRVADTIGAVGSWLHQGVTDWDVTNADLRHIREALEELSPDELDRVIAGLTPRQLTRWIEEMGHRGNGFSRAEKQQLFADLAAVASTSSLDAIHAAILAAPGAAENALDFGGAIAGNSPEATVAAFITDSNAWAAGAAPLAGVAPSVAAGGLHTPESIDTVVARLLNRNGAITAILVDDLLVATPPGEPTPLDALTAAVARGGDARLKAQVLAALEHLAADTGPIRTALAARPGSGERERSRLDRAPVTDPLHDNATRILLSDVEQIVQQLATDVDPSGVATSGLMFRLVADERVADINGIVTALRPGPAVDPVRFAAAGNDPVYRYPAAQNLAFVAAALANGLTRYADTAKANVDLISKLAGLAGAVVAPLAPATGAIGTIISGALSGSSEWLAGDLSADGVKQSIAAAAADVEETVVAALRPRLPLASEPPHLGEALLWWEYRYDAVRAGPPG